MRLANQQDLSRRQFIRAGLASTAGLILVACQVDPPPTLPATPTMEDAVRLEPTPSCDHGPTRAQAAGPFYTPDTPQRTSLREPDLAGVPLVVTGKVLTTTCQPIANAMLDFWHADDSGAYDNRGFTYRGHQFSDQDGNFRLETIMPGLYPGRTRHIHVRVQGPATALLTTQLYFPNEAANAADSIFEQALIMELVDGEEKFGRFNFVLA